MADNSNTEGVKAQAQHLASDASDEAKNVAASVKEQGAQIGREALDRGQEVMGQAKQHLREQGDHQTRDAAQGLRRMSEQTRALSEGRPAEAGPLGDVARRASERLDDLATRLEQRGAQGLFDDLESFARRRPGAFLAGATVAGFVVARLLRGGVATSATTSDGSAPDATPGYQATSTASTADDPTVPNPIAAGAY